MALTTYTELKASVADWLNRSDLTAVIPDFISLAEAEMKRRLRRSSTRTTLTISAEETSLPSDCAELRSIVLESGSPSSDKPMRNGTPEMLSERKARNGGSTGRPDTFCHIAGKLVVAPVPDQSYTSRIVYFAQLTPLSGSVASNTVLTEAPDAYLFGALWQAEDYLEHDDAAGKWRDKFLGAIDQLNTVRDNEEHNASLREMRLPRVFG